MIVVPVKEGENIEKALKKFKRKFEKTGTVKELRRRQQFDKPSVTKRLKKERAVYVQQLQQVDIRWNICHLRFRDLAMWTGENTCQHLLI